MVTTEMIAFVKGFADDHDPIGTDLPGRFPFRLRAEHCFRVYRWAQRIHEQEGGDRSVVEISALFHDIGKCKDSATDDHAIVGADICRQYLRSIGFDEAKTDIICSIVASHSHHATATTLEAKIESDADLLDEVGAITVLWDALDEGTKSTQSYRSAYDRIFQAYLRLAESRSRHLHTPTARRFYEERLSFLRLYLDNLALELGLLEATDVAGRNV